SSYCYRDPRDLHSFPTRRSSDLSAPDRLSRVSSGMRELASPGKSARSSNGPPSLYENILLSAQIQIPPLRFRPTRTWSAGRARRDRKSTRLNSSHVKISYAVFCL